VPASLPLDGIRVTDLTQALSGPYCTMLLADLGADVVKVEMPGRGDDSRHWGPPFVGDTAAYFLAVNRNKRSLELDLCSPGGREAAALVAGCDVVVENWRPGTAARLGLDAGTLTGRHPRPVHCSISGFGGDGPPRAGYDQIVQGMSGWMSLTGDGAGEPFEAGVPAGPIRTLDEVFADEEVGSQPPTPEEPHSTPDPYDVANSADAAAERKVP